MNPQIGDRMPGVRNVARFSRSAAFVARTAGAAMSHQILVICPGGIETQMLPSRRPVKMPGFERAMLIFNPAARRMQADRGSLLQRALSGLKAAGVNIQVAPTEGPGDATRL